MTDDDRIDAARRRIAELQTEHRALDEMILGISSGPGCDELRRLKKRKLQVKDAIAQLQMQLVPDVPA